ASNRADGLVVFGFTELKKGYDIPIISVGSTVSGVDSVVGNLADGIDKAVKHLVDLGHKRIAFVGEPLTTGKRDVFLQSLAKYNVSSRAEDIVMADSRFENAGFIGARRLIENKTECTAIVCAYDYIAIGVMRYLEQEGYKIPEDFSVIGMDNIDTSKYLAQSLTTIDSHLEEVCTVVADLMAKKVKNRWVSAKQQIKLSSDLIIRESTGPVKE
ncbi:MAG: LacI family DNA-binding transcriptional regulator, partial [Clostridia bacterium]|nr:LacI family DNA-binding transcriptional regulator [Clostridia bacterium]